MSHTSHPKKCEHKLKYCEQCNVVHCETCKEEWRKETASWAYTNGTSTMNPIIYPTSPIIYSTFTCQHK